MREAEMVSTVSPSAPRSRATPEKRDIVETMNLRLVSFLMIVSLFILFSFYFVFCLGINLHGLISIIVMWHAQGLCCLIIEYAPREVNDKTVPIFNSRKNEESK